MVVVVRNILCYKTKLRGAFDGLTCSSGLCMFKSCCLLVWDVKKAINGRIGSNQVHGFL